MDGKTEETKILVVDDDPDILDALTTILEAQGYTVVTAQDGIEALANLKAKKPNLMILDLLMPRMDGFAVCKELQDPRWAEYRDIPLLVVTSVREEASRRRYELETGLELNVDDYIEKPIVPHVLLERVSKLIKKERKGLKTNEGGPKMESKAKILVVDDDADFVEATKTVLESERYQVIVAYNGDEGLEKAREENPDLIILDIIMPVKDGFSAAEQLKKDPQLSKIPVLMLTGFAQKGGGTSLAVSQGLTLETEDYIDKPVAPEELLRRVKRFLQRTGL